MSVVSRLAMLTWLGPAYTLTCNVDTAVVYQGSIYSIVIVAKENTSLNSMFLKFDKFNEFYFKGTLLKNVLER